MAAKLFTMWWILCFMGFSTVLGALCTNNPIKCESKNYQRKICDTPSNHVIHDVTLKKRLSFASCNNRYGTTNEGKIWVKNGCRGNFNYCYNIKVNGGWSAWKYHACSPTCGRRTRQATRTCTYPRPAYGGTDCPGASARTVSCNTRTCPRNGGWSSWKLQSCSATCGASSRLKTRTCTKPIPANGGSQCQGASTRRVICNMMSCGIKSDVRSSYSSCSVSCGVGQKTRYAGNKVIGVDMCTMPLCRINTIYTTGGGSSPAAKYGGIAGGVIVVIMILCIV